MFAQSTEFDLGSATPESSVFSLNSAYDPYVTGVGVQPEGFDQWATFYSKYRVLSCDAELLACGPDRTYWIVKPGSESASEGIIAAAVDPRSKVLLSTSTMPVKYRKSYDIRELFGLTKDQFGDDDYAAVTTASPTNQFYLKVIAGTLTGVSGTGSCYALLRLKYRIQFFQRLNLNVSLQMPIVSQLKKLNPESEKKVLDYAKLLGSLSSDKSTSAHPPK